MKTIKSKLLLIMMLAFGFVHSQSFVAKAAGFSTNVVVDLTSIVNNHIIWALGGDAKNKLYSFSNSSDGGNTWINHGTSNISSASIITGISAVSVSTAYVSVYSNTPAETGVYKTTDSGTTWVQQQTAVFNGATSFPNFIHFFDATNGVVVGDPNGGYFEIYTTSNGGANWNKVSNANIPISPTGEYGINTRFDFVGDTLWFLAVGDTYLGNPNPKSFKSIDRGLTWTMTASNGTIPTTNLAFSFTDVNNGMMIYQSGTNYNVAKTTNGGTSFSVVSQIPISGVPNIGDVEYIPGTNTVLFSTGADRKISYDDGVTFSAISKPSSNFGTNFDFLNWDTGFVNGVTSSPTLDGIYKAVNTISLIGSNIGTAWTTDLDMTSVDGINYTLNAVSFANGEAKFRQNHLWDPLSRSWGSTTFPVGTGSSNYDPNIPIASGTYNVSFNTLTGIYNFQNLYTAIPDANFEQALYDLGIDTVNGDHQVLTSAISGVTDLDVSSKSIADLTGIKGFTSLSTLKCFDNTLTSLNVNGLRVLTTLHCNNNQLTNINVSGLTALTTLLCYNNQLTSINVSGLSVLEVLDCSANSLTTLNLNGLTALWMLDCNSNNLTNLNLSGLTALWKLDCASNQLTSLNVTGSYKLFNLSCHHNQLTSLNTTGLSALWILDCVSNQLTSLNVSDARLFHFRCNYNPNLSCITVSDPAAATRNANTLATWIVETNASFSKNCGGIETIATINLCKGTVATALTAPLNEGVSLRWYATENTTTALAVAPVPSTSIAPLTKSYFVAPVYASGSVGLRSKIVVNVTPILATPASITGTAAQGALVGTSTTATYSTAVIADAVSYLWTAPLGVSIESGQGTNEITVNFKDVPADPGRIGNLSVVAVNASGCNSLPKVLALTKILPVAPNLKMTDALLPVSASTGLPAAVTSFSKYMGTDTILTLTATVVPTATSYVWELPTGVILLSGATTIAGLTSGTSNEITVNFSGVTKENTSYNVEKVTENATTITPINVLRIGVQAKNGTGSSVTNNNALLDPITTSKAKLLILKAISPAAPKVVMVDALASLSATTGLPVPVTVISKYVRTNKVLKLTATSPLASSFTWELPKGVTLVTGGTSNTSNGTINTIEVMFDGVDASITSLYIGVIAVNGIGSSVTDNSLKLPASSSTAVLLKLTATVPATVSVVSGALAICNGSTQSYTITASPLANDYIVTGPLGSVLTSVTNPNNTTTTIKVRADDNLTFTVKYPIVAPIIKTLSIAAQNGLGYNAKNKVLNLTFQSCSTAREAAPKASVAISANEVYPNPVSNDFNIDIMATEASVLEITIYSLNGNRVVSPKSVQLKAGLNHIQENISTLMKGVYIVRFTKSSNNEVITKKLIKD